MATAYTFRDATLKSVPLQALNRAGSVLERFGKTCPAPGLDDIVSAARTAAETDDLGSPLASREPDPVCS